MKRTSLRELKTCLRALALPILLTAQSQLTTTASAQEQAPKQHFVCHIGYTPKQCHEAVDVLRQVLARYPVADLGEWTWVLVRPEDWRYIFLDGGLSPDRSPAFTILPKRETFFEGALLTRVSFRGFRLGWLSRMPIEDLLDLAVRHELAHAMCNERNEIKADLAAIALKNGVPLSCRGTLVSKSPTEETRNRR
jgi:hypothetical protein